MNPVHDKLGRYASTPIADRFWAKVDRRGPDECWPWIGARSGGGYGMFRSARMENAHRRAYKLLVGPIPDGLELDHLCRNPLCVNPNHLEAVTGRENKLRGIGIAAINAQKTECLRGHAYTPENTVRVVAGRACRECRRQHAARYRQRDRDARKALSTL